MSFVATLATDTETMENPSWPDVERAILALDARSTTLVMLAPPSPKGLPTGEHHMAVGGGSGDRLIVYTTDDNFHFWNLVDPKKRGDRRPVRMVVGGQEGDYREEQFVSRDHALRAARCYVTDGRRAPDLEWTQG
jgi:Immunity protein Imm1